jgi:biotin-independent malonate decarboxylase beta subunit
MTAASDDTGALRGSSPRGRIEALADDGSIEWLSEAGASVHLARFGVGPHGDDGVVTARMRIKGQAWQVAAQDERFLGGSVGARHGAALQHLFEDARAHGAGILLLAASGGVRLHEANAAELALARALRALLDARASGVRAVALAVGPVFGGASVLACATDSLAMLPGTRIGLSGPKVVASALGADEATTARTLGEVTAAASRVRAGQASAMADAPRSIRDWLAERPVVSLATAVEVGCARWQADAQDALDRRAPADGRGPRLEPIPQPPMAPSDGPATLDPSWHATPVGAGLWRHPKAWVVAPFTGRHVGATALAALDDALLSHVGLAAETRVGDTGPANSRADRSADACGDPRWLILLEDSLGHEVSVGAEAALLSRDLAHHAAVLALLRMRGVRLLGVLTGVGHSAAFFAHALQADRLIAASTARVIAMDPHAIGRVTGVAAPRLSEDDPMLGHAVRHFAALGGVETVLDPMTPAKVLALLPRDG